MTQQDLYDNLKTVGLPVVYHSFKASGTTDIPALPWICYLFLSSDNVSGDNKVQSKFNNYAVELYSNSKDIEHEESIENLFDSLNIFYEKNELYIDEEELFMVSYSIQI